MEQRDNWDLRREGIGAVASLMGHVAAATGDRLDASKAMVGNLSVEGLQAASEHLKACLKALDDLEWFSMLPLDKRCDFRSQRMLAIMTAFDVVSAALDEH